MTLCKRLHLDDSLLHCSRPVSIETYPTYLETVGLEACDVPTCQEIQVSITPKRSKRNSEGSEGICCAPYVLQVFQYCGKRTKRALQKYVPFAALYSSALVVPCKTLYLASAVQLPCKQAAIPWPADWPSNQAPCKKPKYCVLVASPANHSRPTLALRF